MKRTNVYSDIKQFNTHIIGFPEPDGEFKPLSKDRLDWFTGVVAEEMHEFMKAYKEEDANEQIDALVDLTVFVLGRLVEMGITGIQFNHIWQQIHEANMNKQLGNKGRGSDQDAVKPEGWKKPKGAF
jgi:hypothetical protein